MHQVSGRQDLLNAVVAKRIRIELVRFKVQRFLHFYKRLKFKIKKTLHIRIE